MHATIIVQQLWGNPNPILLNEPHGWFPALRSGVRYNDDWRGWREHLVGEFVISRVGRNNCKGYIALLRSVSWVFEAGG